MKNLEKPPSADEALFEPEPKGEGPDDFEVPLFATETRKAAGPDDREAALFATERKDESPVDFELPPDFFEPIVLPEEDDAGDHLVQELWPEIPADDPSHDLPQAVERWSDEREPLSRGLRVALLVGALMVVILGGAVLWRVVLRRPQPATTTAAASPAASSPVAEAPLTAPSPDLAAPVTPPASAAATPVVPAPVVRAPVVPPPFVVAPAPASAPAAEPIAPQPPRVVMPQPESQRYTPPAAAPPPLLGIPMPAANDPRPPIVGSPAAPSAAASPSGAPRPESPEPGATPAPSAPVATRAPNATVLSGGGAPAVTDETRLRALMDRYRAAFAALDVDQARSVWPRVDARALSRAFGQLMSQSFDFSSCEVVVTGDRASAGCSGNAEYVTKVGSRAPRVDARVWQFDFRRLGDQQWRIESVVTR